MEKAIDPFLIEDSAFYIEALGGFPGTFIKMAFDTIGEEKITRLVSFEDNKKAHTKSVLVYGDPQTQEIKFFTGVYEGTVSSEPKGNNLRRWKVVKIFIPKGWQKTLAELNDDEWKKFLEEFRQGDHFEKFGQWYQKNLARL
ncbi:MAG: hypothetical protein M1514_02755 [Patescibacteria group bacterium]|nr:hypothetical protein [Patescibacteria group bacterium]